MDKQRTYVIQIASTVFFSLLLSYFEESRKQTDVKGVHHGENVLLKYPSLKLIRTVYCLIRHLIQLSDEALWRTFNKYPPAIFDPSHAPSATVITLYYALLL